MFSNTKLQEIGIGVKKCWVGANVLIGTERYDVMIFDYVEGDTVLNKITTHSVTQEGLISAMRQIAHFVKIASTVQLDKFGGIDNTGIGPVDSWKEFLYNQISFMECDIRDLSPDKKDLLYPFCKKLLNYIQKEDLYFGNIVQGFLVPFDINLSNFLLTKDGEVVILDTESCISGDKLLSIGAWYACTYGTDLYQYFIQEFDKPSTLEEGIISFYGVFKALSILINIARGSDRELELVKPWGNDQYTVIKIIEPSFLSMDLEQETGLSSVQLDPSIDVQLDPSIDLSGVENILHDNLG
jgi:hypothetical protein